MAGLVSARERQRTLPEELVSTAISVPVEGDIGLKRTFEKPKEAAVEEPEEIEHGQEYIVSDASTGEASDASLQEKAVAPSRKRPTVSADPPSHARLSVSGVPPSHPRLSVSSTSSSRVTAPAPPEPTTVKKETTGPKPWAAKTAEESLYDAVEREDHEVAGLIDGAQLDYRGPSGYNVLELAAKNGDVAMVELLWLKCVKAGNARQLGEGALHEAAKRGYSYIMEFLLDRRVKVDTRHVDTLYTPLHFAAFHNRFRTVEVLLDRGADIDARTISDESPLMIAASLGRRLISKLLLDRKATKEIRDRNGKTALYRAVENGYEPVVKLLLERRAKVNTVTNTCRTPLHEAALEGDVDIAKLLIDAGADVKAIDTMGETPLHLAAGTGLESIVKLLLHCGADPRARSDSGRKPYEYVELGKHKRTKRLLRGAEGCDD